MSSNLKIYIISAFNTNGIVYDNSPWRPGREIDLTSRPVSEEDERKLKNLATRIMSNGVEVLVKDKSADTKMEQRKLKFMHPTTMLPPHQHSSPSKTLLSSAVATFINRQHMSALFPLHQFTQHNYIIKTCMTTYTYLTTVVHDKRSAISTFETIVSVVTTESLMNPYATELLQDIKPTKTKYMEVKTIQPTASSNMFVSNYPKIDKRIDNEENINSFDLIQPSESGHVPCTSSCSCSHTKTEGLKTKYTNINHSMSATTKYGINTSNYGATILDRPTKMETVDIKTRYGPYDYEGSQMAPTDRIVEKYTEVVNDYSDEKDSNVMQESELLTNEQGPSPPKPSKVTNNKSTEKPKPEKPLKPNKNKVLVADLLKLGSLGIKGLSQLGPVIEKMTGGFIKRQESNKTTIPTTTTTTTIKPVKITPYHVNKRIDNDIEMKQNHFPIYIPVDELETSESQIIFTNATLHQNLAWAAEQKTHNARIVPPRMIHESPLVNGGIPISPGEVITANSDVIVGKPAVGGPMTLAASGFKLHNPVNPPPIDSFVSANEQYVVKEKPEPSDHKLYSTKGGDDSYDLRPPELPKSKPKPNRNLARPASVAPFNQQNSQHPNNNHHRLPPLQHQSSDHIMKTEHVKISSTVLGNHGRPAFLDYIPAFAKPNNNQINNNNNFRPEEQRVEEIPDNSPSSSEMVHTRITTDGDYTPNNSDQINKPLLVDIQPSRVANVLIPHGSTTALVFAGSSEPHKTGDYIDDPLPYPEPGYFGSFSIDAPQMTNVHNVPPNNNKQFTAKPAHTPMESYKPITSLSFKDQAFRSDFKLKFKGNKRPIDFNKLPPPTSNQESHLRVGPQITAYNPDIYNPNNGDFEKYNNVRGNNNYKDGKEIIDKEYENYLAVPPPPPPKIQLNKENFYDKNKPYSQRPIVHMKPVQDMKVFLNIQHPVPEAPQPEPLPPKITSEIYFAAQAPSNEPTTTYTIKLPPAGPAFENNYNIVPNNNQHYKIQNINSGQYSNSFTVMSSPNFANKSIFTNDVNDKDSTYTVTLNTATNVANNVGETGQVIGSSVPVAIESNTNVGLLNTDIPIGTNFAIKVEDGPSLIDNYNLQSNQNPLVYSDETDRVPIEVSIGDNRWNKSTSDNLGQKFETTIIGQHYYDQNIRDKPANRDNIVPPSLNSHANFPMVNDYYTTSTNVYNDIKPVTEDVDEVKSHDQRRPAKLIPNIPTNSHGWYSSNLFNENSLSKINNIKVEVTTRKSIPLLHDFNNNSVPDFGQKITSNGKPPARYRPQITPPVYSKYNIGKPFTKPTSTTSQSTHRPFLSLLPFTTKPYRPDYILHSGKQPAYDIPIRDNSDETTTIKTVTSTKETVKPVFENSEEVYDGEDDIVENDGEISQESMKVPVITTSNEEHTITNISKSASETTTSRDGVFKTTEDNQIDTNTRVEFDPGTQTEKPFGSNNNTNVFYSNTIRPIYDHMKPRPFTVKTVLDHQLHQPHWQINELMVNSSNGSYEENLSLNIGEEMSSGSTNKPSSTQDVPHYHHVDYENKYRIPQKPTSFSKNVVNDSNIITSTVHINDKKPLIVEKVQHTSTTTLPPISLTTSELDRSSSEIIDLSPPPPTMDYNFKPSTNDEMIMGMSPPPPRTQSSNRPLRTQPTPRPNRTPPPYRSKPPRTLPPRLSSTPKPMRRPISRDEISTYRPAYDIMNNVRRPIYHRDQPSSQLLPPPREIPSRVITPISELPSQTINVPPVSNIVFPTPISSGWLTSSGVGFSSSFDFAPTSVHYPDIPEQSTLPGSLTDNSYSYEMESSSERFGDVNPEKPVTENIMSISKEVSTDSDTKLSSSSEEQNVSDVVASESSHEETTTDKMKVIPISNKNRTRKPYPVRHEDKKPSTNKYRLPSKPTSIIRPTKTLLRPEILYSTRHTSTRKIVRPIPTRTTPVIPISIIESSEMSIEDEFVKPTEVLRQSILPTTILHDVTSFIDKVPTSIVTSSSYEISSSAQPTYQADYTVSDQITPTKTEFRTTVVTLTKTLSESPKTVSSIGYVNLTHTLTITHTKTSLVSQSEGAVTQTLVLTNTHTSTIVDVVTKIRTQVQPTTIIETVTKHIPIIQVEPTTVQEILPKTKVPLDDITMSSEENDNLIIRDSETTENVQKVDTESDSDANTFFVVMNKSQNGGKSPPINTDLETGDYDVTRNEQVNNNGVSQVLFGEILLAGTPYLETTNVVNPTGTGFGKECHPDCKASRNERCQRIDGMMKCVCRPGFARMFPDRPCKPTYTYSVKLALGYQGSERLEFHQSLADNSSKQYHALEVATHEGINRMVMQSDLRDVFHGVHITGFHPVEINKGNGDVYQGVMNDFYVQLSDNAHESRLKEVIEKYLRNNNYSLGGTEVLAAGELMDGLNVSDFDECTSGQFHDCSEHAQCFNLRGTYTCSCLEGFADLSVNSLYPGRICSAEPVGCERCNYHGACYSRDDRRVLCECFQWYAGSTCHINLKVVLISLVVLGALLTIVLGACAVVACRRPRPPPRSIVTCIQGMPSLHQGAMPSKQRADRRALISDRGDSGDASSIQNASLPYMPAKSQRASTGKKCVISEPPSHDPPPPPAPAVMIPRARLHPHHTDSRENVARKRSLDHTSPSEAKLISYLESGAVITNDEMRRKHSMESSYSAHKDRHNKQGALVSAGFKVSTTIRPDEVNMRDDRDDLSSVHKADLEAELHFDSLRKTYSQEDMSEWTDAERRIGELTLSEARSVGGTLPASTGRAASSTRLTHQEANTMAERDLGSTFLLPHVHLYKPDLTSDVSEFDSL